MTESGRQYTIENPLILPIDCIQTKLYQKQSVVNHHTILFDITIPEQEVVTIGLHLRKILFSKLNKEFLKKGFSASNALRLAISITNRVFYVKPTSKKGVFNFYLRDIGYTKAPLMSIATEFTININ